MACIFYGIRGMIGHVKGKILNGLVPERIQESFTEFN